MMRAKHIQWWQDFLEIVPLQIKEISVEYMLICFSKAIKHSKIWSNSQATGKRHILKMENHYSTKFYNLPPKNMEAGK